jgi:uncharacterized membrane protein
MKSRLQIAGHPIHAMVVAYPIALYTAALLCDVLYIMFEESFWFRMAFWAIVFGLVTHLAAAVTGLPDFVAVVRAGQAQKDARRAAASHLVFGLGLFVIQGLNLAVRNGGVVPATGSIGLPLVANLIAVGIVGIQGWYGGELVYRHLIGVDVPEPGEGPPHARHKGKKH